MPRLQDIGRIPEYSYTEIQLWDNDGDISADHNPSGRVCRSTAVALSFVSVQILP
jgi:hypothetical protein